MNFRQLNESFDRLNEKILNEGPGAGYLFTGTFYPQSVSDVKIVQQETNIYNDLEVYFTANIRGIVDIEFASYYYSGELADVPAVATRGFINIEENEDYNPNEIEEYIAQCVEQDRYLINYTYGAGWSHVTYDGTLSTNDDSANNMYSGIQILDLHIVSQEIIDEIDLTVQGEYGDDEYYEEDYTPKVTRGNYGHEGPFWYYTKHGIGPGTLPKDVNVVDVYEDDDFGTWVALDSVLTSDELQEYELKEQTPPER